ncbi:hypothetical protein OK016_29180 [Vibrio chagasii]|nr:hypothetical protein [Vibrio chagasii]
MRDERQYNPQPSTIKSANKDGLKQAKDNGFPSVSQADAMVSSRFMQIGRVRQLPAKTPPTNKAGVMLGTHTLTSQANAECGHYSKGDGRPKGADDLAYDASASGVASVLGSNGLLESTNDVNLCGFNGGRKYQRCLSYFHLKLKQSLAQTRPSQSIPMHSLITEGWILV